MSVSSFVLSDAICHGVQPCGANELKLMMLNAIEIGISPFSGKWYKPRCKSSQWRHNGHDGVSNHQPRGCLLNRLFRHPHKGPVTRKIFPFDDVIMVLLFEYQQLTSYATYINIYICVCWCLCVCLSVSLSQSLSLYIYIYIYIIACVSIICLDFGWNISWLKCLLVSVWIWICMWGHTLIISQKGSRCADVYSSWIWEIDAPGHHGRLITRLRGIWSRMRWVYSSEAHLLASVTLCLITLSLILSQTVIYTKFTVNKPQFGRR